MATYLFQLGNTPELSFRELQAVKSQAEWTRPIESVAVANLESDQAAQELMQRLGGTVKIMRVIADKPEVSPAGLPKIITNLLQAATKDSGKVQFAISELGRDHLPQIEPAAIKERLQRDGWKARYREGSRHGLSAAVLLNSKNIIELYVVQSAEMTYLAQTVAVQDIDQWSKRDRSKPYADRKKGMLPPKVARMMVNLTLKNKTVEELTLLDPFCGSGTILMEAALVGVKTVIGNDQDTAAVTGSKENLAWLKKEYQLSTESTVLPQDATRLELPGNQPVDLLVTEPFLGKQTPNPAQLLNVFKGLRRLYLGAFRQWSKLLKDQAELAVVFPYVSTTLKDKKQQFSLEDLIDNLAELGYTTNSKPVLYHRPNAVVQRQIYQFTYNSNQQK